jgi:hypothetical protein
MQLIETPTVPGAAERILQQSEARVRTALEVLRAATVETFRAFWHGPVPPADLLAVMGTRAAAAFAAHAAAVQLLQDRGVEIAPEETTAPLPFTVNEDGSITLA